MVRFEVVVVVVRTMIEEIRGGVCVIVEDFGHFDVSRSVKGSDCPSVATHCLLEAVVALITRTRDLKAILLDNRGDEGARVCN